MGSNPYQFLWIMICKYVDHKGSPAILGTKRSVGMVPEVNMRDPFHVGKEACK